MAATDTATHVIQIETQAQFDVAVAQLNAYTSDGRQPPLQNRVDDSELLRITFTQTVTVDLG